MAERLVGITWGRDLVGRSAGQGENALKYAELLVRAGLTPVLLTPGAGSAVLRRLDGLLVPGGPDVSPAAYGHQPAPGLGATDGELDALEVDSILAARAARLPILGICRGQQVIDVALGGTLHQHIEHPQWGDDPSQPVHDVAIVEGSFLHRTFGTVQARVNSGHHQAVDQVAPGLRASAFSPDGQVEALEAESLRILAVQWHPEEMADDPLTVRLLAAFAGWVDG
jgi:putative glutamine amidotransferase